MLRKLAYGLLACGGIFLAASILNFFLRRTDDAWILGRWSLSYFAFLMLLLVVVAYVGGLACRFRGQTLPVLLANLTCVAIGAGLLEGAGQIYASVNPAYQVLFLQPDRILGWKMVPDLHWTWTGQGWYAADFSVPVQANSLGFRDLEHAPAKPPGKLRVALLGDSFVEAQQVPLEKTAARLLETKLADTEVLNFGVSMFGVGQYLLTWEQYARGCHPDYVCIFVAGFHLNRTVEKSTEGVLGPDVRLRVRPTFRIENGVLIRQPAEDFDAFVQVQDRLTRDAFHGDRVRRHPREPFTGPFLADLWDRAFSGLQRQWHPVQSSRWPPVDDATLAVNLKIIDELQRQVHDAGGRLAIVDVCRYFDPDTPLADTLQQFARDHRIGYICLSDDLAAANRRGTSTRWKHDGHFNEAGNAIFADALHRWILQTQRRE